jgi:AAA family ATP:ADP antiporter
VALSISQLSLLVCGMIGLWIYLSVTVRREYLNSFRLALEKKTIEPESLRISITDSATLEPILRVLESPDERQVLYAMSLLEGVNPRLWLDALQSLVRHDSSKVRALALERLAAQPQADLAATVRQYLEDPDLAVRTEAVGYLCLLGGDRPEERVKEFLASQDYAIVSAAIQAISKYGWNPEGLIDQGFIERALREEGGQREAGRIAAASALGLASDVSPLQSFLNILLEDQSLEVVRAAIRSCGQIRSRDALPALVRKLADRRLRGEVRQALLRYGSRIVGTLCDYLNDPQESLQVRANIPKVLSSIDSQESVDGLVRALRLLSPFLGYRVIKALNKMRVQFPGLSFSDQAIDMFLLEELKDYYEFFLMLRSQDLNESRSQAVLQLLRKALQERMDQKIERVFRLLGLRYPPNDMYSAYNGLRSQQSHVRASAIEFLDNLLLPDLKQLLFPILEESAIDTLLARGNQRFGLEWKSRVAYLDQLIQGRDEWLQTISLYVAGSLGLVELLGAVRSAGSSQSEAVRETARHSLRMLEGLEAVV